MPAAGGEPKRLTWHPGADVVQGFTVDGSAVLFASQRSMFTNRHFQLFTVPLGGGLPAKLPIPHGLRASYSPDGRRIAYIPTSERFQQWKNYRGGTTSRIWIYDTADHSVQTIPQPEGRSNDTNPTWIGNRVFFRSDRDGEFNLYSFDTGSGEIVRHSEFEDFHVEDLSGSADAIVYEQAGYLHLYDPASDRHERLRIGIAADLTETRPRWIEGPEYIRSASISPSGARAVFGYRGEVLTLPAKKGDARNLTRTPGVHERDPVWSPDGGSIAWFSDEGGEYGLHVRDQESGDVRRYELGGEHGGAGFYHAPEWSPDGSRISYVDNSMTLFVLDLDDGDVAKVASEHYYGPSFPPRPGHSWAPDSRYVAYTLNTRSYMQQVFVYDVEARTSHPVTDGLSEVGEPVFDRSGDYLYFRASTDAGPVKHWFAMSNADMELSSAIYVAVLRQDGESPLAAESDEETVASAGEDEDAADGAGGAADGDRNGSEADGGAGDDGDEDGDDGDEDGPSVEIDFEGLNQRILALPVQAGGYSNLEAGEAGKLYYVRSSPAGRFGGGGGDLVMFDLTEREETVLLSGVVGFSLSADGRKVLYAGRDDFGIANAGGKIDRGESAIPTDKLTIRIDPRAEWKQIYDEVWRINRDYFYDPGMHGADWPAMAEKYSGFLADVATRDDLNRVLRWMCSEIAVGHHRVGGGDRRADPERVGGGLLGADFEIADGRYRFAHVLGGLNWNPELRAPLTEPGVSVTAGEYLLAVDGVDLEASDNVFSRFENTAGKITDITVGPNADGSGSRTVSVVPIGNESALRNREWVEGNLAKVDEATGRPGRLRLRAEHDHARPHLLQALLLSAGPQAGPDRRRAVQRRRPGRGLLHRPPAAPVHQPLGDPLRRGLPHAERRHPRAEGHDHRRDGRLRRRPAALDVPQARPGNPGRQAHLGRPRRHARLPGAHGRRLRDRAEPGDLDGGRLRRRERRRAARHRRRAVAGGRHRRPRPAAREGDRDRARTTGGEPARRTGRSRRSRSGCAARPRWLSVRRPSGRHPGAKPSYSLQPIELLLPSAPTARRVAQAHRTRTLRGRHPPALQGPRTALPVSADDAGDGGGDLAPVAPVPPRSRRVLAVVLGAHPERILLGRVRRRRARSSLDGAASQGARHRLRPRPLDRILPARARLERHRVPPLRRRRPTDRLSRAAENAPTVPSAATSERCARCWNTTTSRTSASSMPTN